MQPALAARKGEVELGLKTTLAAAHLATWEYDLATGVMICWRQECDQRSASRARMGFSSRMRATN